MKTVTLPALDHTGELTPLVLDALKLPGVSVDNDPADPHGSIILTFDKEAAAKAFKGKIALSQAYAALEKTHPPEDEQAA